MVRQLVTELGIATCWLRESARSDPDGNAKAYWIVARSASSSMRSMKAPSSSAAACIASSVRNVSGSATSRRIWSSVGRWLVFPVSASALKNRSLSIGNVLSVMTAPVISRTNNRFSSLDLKFGTHEFRQVYRGYGSSPSLISPWHLAHVSRVSMGKAGAVAVVILRSCPSGLSDAVYLHCKSGLGVY